MFAIRMLKYFLVFSVANILQFVFYGPVTRILNGDKTTYSSLATWACVAVSAFCYVASYSAENLAMWYFGYHYYNCGKKLWYYMRQQSVPASLDRNLRLLWNTAGVVNIALPVAYVCISTYQYYQQYNQEPVVAEWAIYVPYFGIGLMQLLAFLLLARGVQTIRKLIVQNNSTELNNRILLLHSVSFALYLIAGGMIYLTIILDITGKRSHTDGIIVMASVSMILFTLMMMSLLLIISRMAQPAVVEERPK